jgi:hypothetical protein
MISNSQPYAAVIREPQSRNFDLLRFLPIVGWCLDGTAMAVWNSELVPVKTIPGYEKISVHYTKINAIEVPTKEAARKLAEAEKNRSPWDIT